MLNENAGRSTTAYSAFLGSCTVLVLFACRPTIAAGLALLPYQLTCVAISDIHPIILNIAARGAYTKSAPWSLGRLSLPVNVLSVLFVILGSIAFCFPSYTVFDATTMSGGLVS